MKFFSKDDIASYMSKNQHLSSKTGFKNLYFPVLKTKDGINILNNVFCLSSQDAKKYSKEYARGDCEKSSIGYCICEVVCYRYSNRFDPKFKTINIEICFEDLEN